MNRSRLPVGRRLALATVLSFPCVLTSLHAQSVPVDKEIAGMPEGTTLRLKVPASSGWAGAPSVPGALLRRPRWSSDGRHVAWITSEEGEDAPVHNADVGPVFDFVDPPVFGADGGPPFFRVGKRTADNRHERWWVWSGGRTIAGPFDWMGSIGVSPDGDRLAFWVQPGAKIANDGAYVQRPMQMWLDGRLVGKKYDDALALAAPVFSADGRTCYSVASKGGTGYCVVRVGRRKVDELDASFPMADGVAVGPRGREVLLAGMDPVSAFADRPPVAGEQPDWKTEIRWADGKSFDLPNGVDKAADPVFSPDGKRVAYRVVIGDRVGIAVDDEVVVAAEHDWVGLPRFSPNGRRIAVFVADGCTSSPGTTQVGRTSMRVAHDGTTRIAVVELGRRGSRTRILPGSHMASRWLAWSPSGERLAFLLRDTEQNLDIVYLQEVAAKEDRDPVEVDRSYLFGRPRWSGDGRLEYGVLRDSTFCWRRLGVD